MLGDDMRARVVGGVVMALSLGLAACGAGSSVTAAIAALTVALKKDASSLPKDATDDQVACTAKGVVKALGSKRLIEVAGLDKIVLTEPEATKATTVFFGCFDVRKALVASAVSGGKISDSDAKCIVDKLDGNLLKSSVAANLQGLKDAPATAQLAAAIAANTASCRAASGATGK